MTTPEVHMRRRWIGRAARTGTGGATEYLLVVRVGPRNVVPTVESSSTRHMMSRAGTSRRAWLAGALAGVTAAYLAPISRAVAQEAGTKILILGDSMIAGAFGLYLERELTRRYGYLVKRRGKSSSGLARPDFFDWLKEGARQRERVSPDAVVVMFGGNDGQGLHMGKRNKPEWIRWNDAGWTGEYARRVSAFYDQVAPSGERVFWLGMPVMRPQKLNRRVQVMNEIFREQMHLRGPRAHFLDIWPVLAGPDGGYAERLRMGNKRIKVRAGDGVHLTRRGAHHVVAHVAPRIDGPLRGE
ncbi:MAG: DUF459 domain-containing protein [Nannocystaceae bacterium]